LALEKDLSAAHTVQMGLLPKSLPSIEGYEFFADSIPAKSVAGDLYDFIRLEDGRLAFSLGDVYGKGMPAALLMANVQATIRAYSRLNPDPEQCLGRSNNLLFSSTAPDKFITLFYGVLDADKNLFTYTNAGHEEPNLFHRGKPADRLNEGGVPLGVVEDFPFQNAQVEIQKGDVLVFCSDGVHDAVSAEGERFRAERVEAIVSEALSLSAAEIAARVFEEVKTHVADAPQFDDMTLLVMKRSK
jgi:sigma-B regulation protein RsbU (phosphoserine phosphatase)